MDLFPLRRWIGTVTLAAGMLAAGAVQAATGFSQIFFFGDSLSDTGNTNFLTGGAFPDAASGPYAGGRFSDGPLWTEVMASLLGLPGNANAALNAGGNNFAFAGARTGFGLTSATDPPGVLFQSLLFAGGVPAADPNALYVVVGGGNDMRDARSAFPGSSAADAAGREAAAQVAIGNLGGAISVLAGKGAKNVLVASLPDLGNTPEATDLGLVAASADASARFNGLMPALVAAGGSLGLNMSFVDFAAIASVVRFDATVNGGATFGITDISHPCAGFVGSTGSACSASAFSDDLHPSARVHALFGYAAAQAALASISPVPEPASALLLAAGLAAVGGAAQRRRHRGH